MLLKFLPRLTACLSFTSFQHDTSHHHPKAADSHLPAAARPGAPTIPLTLLSYSCRIQGVFCSAIPVLPVISVAGSVLKPCPSLDLDNFCWVALLLTNTNLHTAPPCFSPPALLPLPSPKCEQFPCSVLC